MYEYIGLPAKVDQLLKSANKLGEPVISIEVDPEGLEDVSEELLEVHLNVLALLAKSQKQIYSICLQLTALYEISGLAAGYAGGKVMDTNEDPSDLKTWATLLVSGWVGYGIGGALSNLLLSQKIEGIAADESLKNQIVNAMSTLAEAKKQAEFSHSDFPPEAKKNIDDIRDLLIKISSTVLIIRSLSGIASAYHGFKRNNDSLGYGLAWGVTGLASATPIGLALEQGFAKPLN